MLVFSHRNSPLTCYRSWVLAADSTIEHLASHPASRPDLTYLAAFDHTTLKLSSGHLACFDGGNFILGGLVLDEQKYVDFGLELVASCENTYNQTLTGIGPDGFGWDASKVPANQKEFYERAGFYITSGYYLLRPEVLESFYYAYRATGDRKYRDVCFLYPSGHFACHIIERLLTSPLQWSFAGFENIVKYTRVGSGYSSITDVNAADGGDFTNFQESFFFAEVLKYAYLIHADQDAEFQVAGPDGKNQWVFNTEAHPVRVSV